MSDSTGFLPTQVLVIPEQMGQEDRAEILEAAWWHLSPGEVGYNQPIWAYCGFTEDQWRQRQMDRGWRR